MTDFWISTKSPMNMFRGASYQTDDLAVHLRDAAGVDPSIIAADTGVSEHCIRAYQRKLGLRKCTPNNPRYPNE